MNYDLFSELIDILKVSVEWHGKDRPLTIGHLLNILKMVDRRLSQDGPDEGDGWEDP